MIKQDSSESPDWDKEFPIFTVNQEQFIEYPLLARFLEIPDAPKKIYCRGKFPDPSVKYLAVVGSRQVTTYGKDAVKSLIDGLAGQPICIISGLALGVDGLSHEAALNNELPTISIPGSGLGKKTIYPSSHRRMADRILKAGGLLLSEIPTEFGASAWSFQSRNRLMAALSDAVLVVEAKEQSGSLITARFAAEYNRDLWCVPGPINSPNSVGTNRFIKDGAGLIQNSNDILHNFRLRVIKSDKEAGEETATQFPLPQNLTDTEALILTSLIEPTTKDSLMQKLGIEIGTFLTALTMLEMKGHTKEEVGILRRVK